MPWTLAHPAAVLPLRVCGARQGLFVALVVGSLSPDLGYSFRAFQMAGQAHSLAGLFAVCLPVGLVTLGLVAALGPALAEVLWEPHRSALRGALTVRCRSLGEGLGLVAALLVGALTHVAWDSATHAHGWVVAQAPFLQRHVATLAGREVLVCNVLQHLSTVVGLAVLVPWYRAWLRRQPAPVADQPRWGLLLGLAAAAVVAATPTALAVGRSTMPGDILVPRIFLFQLLVTAPPIYAGLLVLAGVRLRRRVRALDPASPAS